MAKVMMLMQLGWGAVGINVMGNKSLNSYHGAGC